MTFRPDFEDEFARLMAAETEPKARGWLVVIGLGSALMVIALGIIVGRLL